MNYPIPAALLQQLVQVLNARPAGEVFLLLVALKQIVDAEEAKQLTPPVPTMGRQE